MDNIKNLFDERDKRMMQQKGINVDVKSLPDMDCIKCGNVVYFNVTRVKKLSKIASPTGQEGNININMLRCANCGWMFNPNEWEQHQRTKEEEKKNNRGADESNS